MNFFLELYQVFQKMGQTGKDLDHMLGSLPWQLKETKPDGTKVWECKIETEIK